MKLADAIALHAAKQSRRSRIISAAKIGGAPRVSKKAVLGAIAIEGLTGKIGLKQAKAEMGDLIKEQYISAGRRALKAANAWDDVAEGLLEEAADSFFADRWGFIRESLKDGRSNFKSTDGDEWAYSDERAAGIAEYEMGLASQEGISGGLESGDVDSTKFWVAEGDNPCEGCLENEDDEEIPREAMFSSGHMTSPAHIGCQCEVYYSW